MKTMSLPLFLATIVLSSPAFAEDPPVYTVENYCEVRWKTDARMMDVCVQQQQASYDALKARWTSIPTGIVQQCRDRWDKSNDYVMLHFCIEEEVLALTKADAPPPE